MKKLTAGIFATLLAVVSTGAANAEIASKGYVDQQVGTKADAATVTTLQGTVSGHTTQIAGKADKATTLAGYGITDGATKTELTEGLAGKVDNADITDMQVKSNLVKTAGWDTDKTDDTKYPSAAAVNDAIIEATTGLANEGAITEIQGDITEIQGDVTQLQTDVSAKQNKNMGSGAANHIVTTDGTGNITSSATIANTQVSGLGSLATKSTVTSADITDGTIAEGDLNASINASLDKADTALQAADLAEYVTKTAADAAYADIATEGVASTASTKAQTALDNIGTLTNLTTEAKGNTVAAINEVATEAAAAASAASAADTKAGQAQSAATAAQGDVDALEAVVNNETTGLAAAHTAIDALESGKLDATGTAARATADASGNVITTTYATKAEIADMATDENLAQKQDKTDNSLATTSKTVVGAINEVRGTANTAKSTADSALATANAAIPAPSDACADSANKCVLVSSGAGNYSWEVIARGDAE